MTLVYNPPASYIYVCVCVMKNGQECASVERHAHRRDDERNVVQRLFKLTVTTVDSCDHWQRWEKGPMP